MKKEENLAVVGLGEAEEAEEEDEPQHLHDPFGLGESDKGGNESKEERERENEGERGKENQKGHFAEELEKRAKRRTGDGESPCTIFLSESEKWWNFGSFRGI